MQTAAPLSTTAWVVALALVIIASKDPEATVDQDSTPTWRETFRTPNTELRTSPGADQVHPPRSSGIQKRRALPPAGLGNNHRPTNSKRQISFTGLWRLFYIFIFPKNPTPSNIVVLPRNLISLQERNPQAQAQ